MRPWSLSWLIVGPLTFLHQAISSEAFKTGSQRSGMDMTLLCGHCRPADLADYGHDSCKRCCLEEQERDRSAQQGLTVKEGVSAHGSEDFRGAMVEGNGSSHVTSKFCGFWGMERTSVQFSVGKMESQPGG